MSSEVLGTLGIDLDNFEWQDVALCRNMPTNDFYDNYETSESVAKAMDDACLSCPVLAQCLERGVENSEWGVWGGIYLTSGKPDTNKNAHKTQEVWEAIRERIGEGVL